MFIFRATSSYFLSASTARYFASFSLFSNCSIWSSLAMVSLSRSFLTRSGEGNHGHHADPRHVGGVVAQPLLTALHLLLLQDD